MEEFVPRDIVAMLSPQVHNDGNLQSRQCDASSRSHGKMEHTDSDDGDEYVDLLKNVYQDQQAINYSQKEKIATQVLKGEYGLEHQLLQNNDKSMKHNPFHHQAHSNAVLKRHLLSHRMFELTSQPASFNSADVDMKKTIAVNRSKEIGRGPQHYVSRGQQVPTVPIFVPEHKSKQQIKFPPRSEIVAQQISLNASKIKQFRGTSFDHKGEYAKQKRREIEIKKKMVTFKEKLWKRLKEKHDPQLTSIMRTLDDNVIYNFIESYKGCTMSVDAILMHIGANVTAKQTATDTKQLELAAPEQCSKKISDANGYQLNPREFKSKGAGFRYNARGKRMVYSAGRSGIGDDWTQDWQEQEGRPYSPSVLSMQAMQKHMSEEHLLPSMQPDKAITDDELEKLGKRKTSCDNLRRSKNHLGKVEVASRRPPRSLKTTNPDIGKNSSGQNNEVKIKPSPLPTLSSTNYGDMYVISSYKENVT